jgi:transcriptional regulator with XRE-family HTH domain
MSKSDNTGIGSRSTSRKNTNRLRQANRKSLNSGVSTGERQMQRDSNSNSSNEDNDDLEKLPFNADLEEGNILETATASQTLATQLPLNAILAKLRARKEQEQSILPAQTRPNKRQGLIRSRGGEQARAEASLIIGTSDEALLPPGNRIRLRRLANKIQQNELAAAASINQATLSLIENGDRDSSPEVIIRLAYLLGINPPTDIYRYYEFQLKEQEKEQGQEQSGAGAADSETTKAITISKKVGEKFVNPDLPSPEFLYLPPELNADDKKMLNNMAISLLRVRMAEKGVSAERVDQEILDTYRTQPPVQPVHQQQQQQQPRHKQEHHQHQ